VPAESTSPLAAFTDRRTLHYDRRYPHPIELVWEAVSTAEHLDVWLLPVSRVERHAGGACSFTWGGPADDPAVDVGTVTVFDPPNAIQYTMDDGFMRFDLERDGDGTRLRFTHSFAPGAATEPSAAGDGSDQPAGPDTPWRPGFVAGFHLMLDQLDLYLQGEWTALDKTKELDDMIAGRPDPEFLRMIAVYREHIRDHCPPD
jgi:uncharacterized protein YndB with AHSA1/START domain